MKTTFVIVGLLLSLANLTIAQKTTAKRPIPTTIAPGVLEGSSRLVSGIKGAGRQNEGEWLRCAGVNSSSPYAVPWRSGGYAFQIKFDYGVVDNRIIGSWTVRVWPPDREKQGHIGSREYYFDGTFTSANIAATNSTYELRGIASYAFSYCRINDPTNVRIPYNIRIWGNCGTSIINFEATDQATGAVYATATFNREVEVTCGPVPLNSIRTDYNRH